MKPKFSHKPVLLEEVISLLNPSSGESVLDVTVGLGGHVEEMVKVIGKNGTFTALDADKENLEASEERLAAYSCEKEFIYSNFINLPSLNLPKFDCILADLGLSSAHIDDESRGFTFKYDVPLDMRFDRSKGITAAKWIDKVETREIALVLSKYGEIKGSMKLAKQIKRDSPETTGELKKTIESILGHRAIKLLPQIFQAFRIEVNRELEALEVLLKIGPELLKPGGRMAIISFHSLEDRMVKQTFKLLSSPKIDEMTGQTIEDAPYKLITKKPITPSEKEVDENSRARSAKLRVIKRIIKKE